MGEARLAQHIGAHFDHVLVDEYQDTNRLQAEILHALRPDGAGLAVVGDDAQAIYSFRAAAVENILGFPERFDPPAEVVTLAQNYRSTQQVLDVANAVMAEAPRQHRKYLLSIRGQGARPRVVTVDELQTQAEYVCTEVLKKREANVALKRQAVLFRSASHSDMLEVELAKRKIPYVKYGGLKFLEAAHIKDLLGGAALGRQPAQCAGRVPRPAAAARHGSGERPQRHRAPRGRRPQLHGPEDFHAAADRRDGLAAAGRPAAGPRRSAGALAGTGESGARVVPPHFERLYEQFHTRLGDLDQLEMLSGQYPSRERFVTELTLDPPHATSDLSGRPTLDEDYLVLSTIHSAKGMEWDTVYLLNVVDGSFPSEFATGKAELIEEERRLLYVALTRAQNELALVTPLKFHLTQQSRTGDAHLYGGRSRFMTDKVHKTLDAVTFHSTTLAGAESLREASAPVTVDVSARLRDMW